MKFRVRSGEMDVFVSAKREDFDEAVKKAIESTHPKFLGAIIEVTRTDEEPHYVSTEVELKKLGLWKD